LSLAKFEVVNGVEIHRIRTTDFGRNWIPGRVIDYLSYFVGMSWKLLKLTNKDDVVVGKTDPPLTSVITSFIAKLKNAKHICWIQDLFPEVVVALNIKIIPKFFIKFLIWIRNLSLKRSSVNVVIGERMKQKLLASGITEDSIRILPNWSDGENVHPVSKHNNSLVSQWNLENKFVVGYSGNMGRVHEFDTLMQAADRLKSIEDIVFIFIGGGPQKDYIQSLKNKLNLSNVLFFPYQDYNQLSESLSLPDVHIISLRPQIEGLCVPSKFYGVMAAGRPVIFIGDQFGEIAQFLKRDGTGSSVAQGDVTNLVQQIKNCYQHTQLIQQLSCNARSAFELRYAKRLVFFKWESLLNSL